jgi:hypothetical protein
MTKAKKIPSIDAEASLFVHAAVAIATRLDEVMEYERFLADPSFVLELHEMRIAAKRLRYTMDLFLPAFNDYSKHGSQFASMITHIKLLQEHLGEIHDADVLVPRLAARLREILGPVNTKGKAQHTLPAVGVHLSDFDSCQGLLTLCIDARDKRESRFGQLNVDWKRMRETQVFEELRKLLRAAITDETLAAVLHEPGPGVTTPDSAITRDFASKASKKEIDRNITDSVSVEEGAIVNDIETHTTPTPKRVRTKKPDGAKTGCSS